MEKRNIVVIGASAGGVEALQGLVAGLPADMNAALFVVLHIPPHTRSYLPEILNAAGPLKAMHPVDGQLITNGHIYVAPNDHHMVLDGMRIMVRRGPKENRMRPSIDALFRSAAFTYRERVTGIILSGTLNDGVSGMWTVKELGGATFVQSLEEAMQPQLPENVLEYVTVDHVMPVEQMGRELRRLSETKVARPEMQLNAPAMERMEMEVTIACSDSAYDMGIMNKGTYTPLTCDECNGALMRFPEANILRYRCHTGHAYTASALLASVTAAVETKLWQAMRAMEEVNMLMKTISDHYMNSGDYYSASLFESRAEEGLKSSKRVRESIMQQLQFSEDLRLDHFPPSTKV
jgi:two-component system, chemotaxis family, protein-glutamate methylesterase/glutaminase